MFKLAIPNCPECGEPAKGSVEKLSGRAEFTEPDRSGLVDWAGDTEVWWEEQKTQTNENGDWNLICPNAHEWYSAVQDIEAYSVVDLDTDESHGTYETLSEARGCVAYDKLRAYSITHDGVRVESCEPYDGDDDRARQGLGQL